MMNEHCLLSHSLEKSHSAHKINGKQCAIKNWLVFQQNQIENTKYWHLEMKRIYCISSVCGKSNDDWKMREKMTIRC